MDDTEQRIIEAAVKVFSEKGFSGTSTREIAATAGVNEVTLFRKFGSKKNILNKIIHRAVEVYGYHVVVEPVMQILDEKNMSHRQKLIKLLKNRYEIINAHFPLLKIVMQESGLNEDIRKLFVEKVVSRAKASGEEFIKKAIEEGEFKKSTDPSIAVLAIIGMLMFFFVWQKISFEESSSSEIEKSIEKMVDIFLNGVSAKKN